MRLLSNVLLIVEFSYFLSPVTSFENGLGRTPQMGWSSYNAFKCNISEDLILYTARRMKELGFQKAGYTYINVDDCWQSHTPRNSTPGNIIAPHPTRFPHGMKWLGDRIHELGFKFGLYTGSGYIQCVSHTPASFGWEEHDAQTFADWGVDYVKYDNCAQGVGSVMPAYDKFKRMSDAILRTGRPMFLSLCQWGNAFPWFWAHRIANSYRMSGDIWEYYEEDDPLCTCKTAYCIDPNPALCSITTILHKMRELSTFQRPGSWADMDMLEIGIGNLTLAEQRTHFSYWAALKSPLIMGAAMHNISKAQIEIMTHEEIIGINQDRVGKAVGFVGSAGRSKGEGREGREGKEGWDRREGREGRARERRSQVWVGEVTGGWIVLVTNDEAERADLEVRWEELGISKNVEGGAEVKGKGQGQEEVSFRVRDIWAREDLGTMTGGVIFRDIEAHETKVLKIRLPTWRDSMEEWVHELMLGMRRLSVGGGALGKEEGSDEL